MWTIILSLFKGTPAFAWAPAVSQGAVLTDAALVQSWT
jgi:hypothetical protein